MRVVLDLHPHALIVIDSLSRVVFSNAAASRLMNDGEPSPHIARALRLGTPSDSRRVRTLVEEILSGHRRHGAVRASTPVDQDGQSRDCFVMATVLESPSPSRDRCAVLFIADPDCFVLPDSSVLRDLFRITKAEAELIEKLGAGHTLNEVAISREVRVSTVRSQLSSILFKTGVDRQATLMALLSHIALPSGKQVPRKLRREDDDGPDPPDAPAAT